MALDTSNNVRVDLQELFNSCEEQSEKHFRREFGDLPDFQHLVITKDDYALIFPWANDAAVLIADRCNYITNTTQTGLDAISNPYTTMNPNPHDDTEIVDLVQSQKQTGEYLSKAVMDTMEFNVDQMEGMTPLKYSVTQSQIRAAMIEFILFKWYELNGQSSSMAMKWSQFQFWLNQLANNSLNNQKAIRARKSYNMF
jgi:hypothetical protein